MASSLARFVMILTAASMLLFSFGATAAVPVYTGPATVSDRHAADGLQAILSGIPADHPVIILAILSFAVTGLMMATGRVTWRLGAAVILGSFLLFGSAALMSDIPSASAMAH